MVRKYSLLKYEHPPPWFHMGGFFFFAFWSLEAPTGLSRYPVLCLRRGQPWLRAPLEGAGPGPLGETLARRS